MKLEDQICSLELSKRLKELGVPQKSLFYWIASHKNDGSFRLGQTTIESRFAKKDRLYSAFTASELGEMFPDDGYTYFSFKTKKADDSRLFWIAKRSNGQDAHYEEDFTEVSARAKMLIYLIENKLIEVPK